MGIIIGVKESLRTTEGWALSVEGLTMVAKEEVITSLLLEALHLFTAEQTAGARQVLKQSPTWVSKNIAKQHLTKDGGGVSNRQQETPGFLVERGFLIRLIHEYVLYQC